MRGGIRRGKREGLSWFHTAFRRLKLGIYLRGTLTYSYTRYERITYLNNTKSDDPPLVVCGPVSAWTTPGDREKRCFVRRVLCIYHGYMW